MRQIHATCQGTAADVGRQDVVAAVHPEVIDGHT